MQSSPSPTQNLTAAFLFLRTASVAVTNLTAQIESTKADKEYRYRLEGGSFRGNPGDKERLEAEQRDLKMWEVRLVQARVGVVNWAAKVKTRRFLPAEILGMIGERLQKNDLVLPGIW